MNINYLSQYIYFKGNFSKPELTKYPKDFHVIEPDVNLLNVKEEADRCLSCKTPKCVEACPVHNDIPLFIKAVKYDDLKTAGQLLREKQSLPSVCGRICFHKCEDACVRGKKGEPVSIGNIERYIGDNTVNDDINNVTKTGKKVAIIGGGPTGITAAKELIKKGHDVIIYETNPEMGGVLRYGIPSFRLPKESFEKEINYLKNNGVKFVTNKQVGTDVHVQDLRDLGIDSILVCSGTTLARKLNIPGEDLNGVFSSQAFLKRVKLAESKDELNDIKGRVIIIGGGNVAMDAARSALRLGCEDVSIIYRRSQKDMPARKNEVEDAIEEGVNFQFQLAPTEIIGDENNNVKEVKFEKMLLSDPDENGKSSTIHTGEFINIPADNVVVALGSIPNTIIKKDFEHDGVFIMSDKKGQVDINKNSCETNIEGIFAGGDVAPVGALTLADAIAAGRKASNSIDEYLNRI